MEGTTAVASNEPSPTPKVAPEMDNSSIGAFKGASSDLDGAATQQDQRPPNNPQVAGETQIMSNSMLKAYVAMRGPQGSTADVFGPLSKWMKRRSERFGEDFSQSGDKHGISELMEIMGGDISSDVVFEIPKAPFNPAEYPAGFSWEGDSDDEEGDGPCGRITADTFLVMAKDSKRWDQAGVKDPEGVLNDAVRTRPEEPTAPAHTSHRPEYLDKSQTQIDEITGEVISPSYDVPVSPSMIWTPPGVEEGAYAPETFFARYSRMAPRNAAEHITHYYGRPEYAAPPANTHEKYTTTEAQEVANKVHGKELGPHLDGFLESQYNSIAQYELHGDALSKEIDAQKERIAAIEKEREQLKFWYIPTLKQLRAQRAALAAANQQSRENRIREHIANHVRDAQYRLDRACVRVSELQHKYTQNMAYLDKLQQDMSEACLLVGKESPQEVYDEVNGPESPRFAPATLDQPEMTSHGTPARIPVGGPNTMKQSSVKLHEDPQNGDSYLYQPKSKSYGDIQQGSQAGPSTPQPFSKMSVDNYVASIIGSQMKSMALDRKNQATSSGSQRPGSRLYGNQEDAYGTLQQSGSQQGGDYGNVGPSIQSTSGNWSVVPSNGADTTSGSLLTHPTQPSQPSQRRRLRRSYRDVSETSLQRSCNGAKQKDKGKEPGRDADSGATSSSWDTEMF
ncbi:hypothetical protein F5Y13DRAFT_199340 [Hypoxylon sp. FL1857]|nr:hypothetical protein F5Y13DRAFT_199340 [Hypoxylon sp. FL1857]